MPVTDVTKDLESRTITVTSEFAAPVDRVWQIWEDPRQLERWWGPPTHPATFTDHDLTPGARVKYFLTGPDGEVYPGYWDITEVAKPTRLAYDDGFADADGEPQDSAPVGSSTVDLVATDTGTRMVMVATYPSAEDLQKVLDMGMEEGITSAVNQVDGLLAA
jgi:uncharacterized protein YndB with AHSA1/START domain